MNLTDFINDGDEKLPAKVRKQASSSSLPGCDEFGDDIQWGDTGMIDHVLQGRSLEGSETTALRALTDRVKSADVLKLPVVAGTRVSFTHNLGSVLAYANLPEDKGTVVTVRHANGNDVTVHNGMVMVAWDDGQFLPVSPEHLRRVASNTKKARQVRQSFIEFSSISDLFEQSRTGSTDLVHKATKDLWAFREEGGEFVIERLFNEDGKPLKV